MPQQAEYAVTSVLTPTRSRDPPDGFRGTMSKA
jgi:hypothetical protein